jgi:RecA-family ATPase
VLLFQAEDSVRKTLVHRSEAAGADPQKIAVIEQATIPDDEQKIEQVIREMKAKLVVIDPLMCFVTLNASKEQAMRQALTPLKKLAERRNIGVILVRHLNKGGGRHPLYRGSGSIAITAATRSAFLVAELDVSVGARYRSMRSGPTVVGVRAVDGSFTD